MTRSFAVRLLVILAMSFALAFCAVAQTPAERTVEPSDEISNPTTPSDAPEAVAPRESAPTSESRKPVEPSTRRGERAEKTPESKPSARDASEGAQTAPRPKTTPERRRETPAIAPKTLIEPIRAQPDAVDEATDAVPTAQSDRPATWTDAYWKERASLETRFANGEYWELALETVGVLRGNRLMREYLDNAGYLRWTILSVALLVVGQAALFAYVGAPIRRMAILLPRRPLGPVLLGGVGVAVIAPITVGLIYSFVGIPVALALWAFLYAAAIAGKMGVFLSIGWGISRAFGGKGGSVLPFFGVYFAYLALVILDPFSTGRVFFVAANLVGIGLALRTRFGFGVHGPEPETDPKPR